MGDYVNGVAVPLKRLRDHHYRAAMLLAAGKRPGEVAAETGNSLSTIYHWQNEPLFEKLVEGFRVRAMNVAYDQYALVTAVRANIELLGLEEMRDRLVEAPETLSMKDLNDIVQDAADRLGHVKVSRNESVNVNVDLAESLQEARRRELSLSASASPDAGGSLTSEDPHQ